MQNRGNNEDKLTKFVDELKTRNKKVVASNAISSTLESVGSYKLDERDAFGFIPVLPNINSNADIDAYISASLLSARGMLNRLKNASSQCDAAVKALKERLDPVNTFVKTQGKETKIFERMEMNNAESVFMSQTISLVQSHFLDVQKGTGFWTNIPAKLYTEDPTKGAEMKTLLYWSVNYLVFMIMGVYNSIAPGNRRPDDFFNKLMNIQTRSAVGAEIIDVLSLPDVHDIAVDLGLGRRREFTDGVDIVLLSGFSRSVVQFIFSAENNESALYKNYMMVVKAIVDVLYQDISNSRVDVTRDALNALLPDMRHCSTVIYQYIIATRVSFLDNIRRFVASSSPLFLHEIREDYLFDSFGDMITSGMVHIFKQYFPFQGIYIQNIDTPYDHYMEMYKLTTSIPSSDLDLPLEFYTYKPDVLNFISNGHQANTMRLFKTVKGGVILPPVFDTSRAETVRISMTEFDILYKKGYLNMGRQVKYMFEVLSKLIMYEHFQLEAESARMTKMNYSKPHLEAYLNSVNIFLRLLLRRLRIVSKCFANIIPVIENFYEFLKHADEDPIKKQEYSLMECFNEISILTGNKFANIYELMYQYIYLYYIDSQVSTDVLNVIVFCYRAHHKDYPMFINPDLVRSILYKGGFIRYSWGLSDFNVLKDYVFYISSFRTVLFKTTNVYGVKAYTLSYTGEGGERYIRLYTLASMYIPIIDSMMSLNENENKQISNVLFGMESRTNLYNMMLLYKVNINEIQHDLVLKALKVHLFVINCITRLCAVSLLNKDKLDFVYSTPKIGDIVHNASLVLNERVSVLTKDVMDVIMLFKSIKEKGEVLSFSSIATIIQMLQYKLHLTTSIRVTPRINELNEKLNACIVHMDDVYLESSRLRTLLKDREYQLTMDVNTVNMNIDTCYIFMGYVHSHSMMMLKELYSSNKETDVLNDLETYSDRSIVQMMGVYRNYTDARRRVYSFIYVKYMLYKRIMGLLSTWKHANFKHMLHIVAADMEDRDVENVVNMDMYSDISTTMLKYNTTDAWDMFIDNIDDEILKYTSDVYSHVLSTFNEFVTVTTGMYDNVVRFINTPALPVAHALDPNVTTVIEYIHEIIAHSGELLRTMRLLTLPTSVKEASGVAWVSSLKEAEKVYTRYVKYVTYIISNICEGDVNIYDQLNNYFVQNVPDRAEYLNSVCGETLYELIKFTVIMGAVFSSVDVFRILKISSPILKISEMKIFFQTPTTTGGDVVNVLYSNLKPVVMNILYNVDTSVNDKDVEIVNRALLYEDTRLSTFNESVIIDHYRQRDRLLEEIQLLDAEGVRIDGAYVNTSACALNHIYTYCMGMSTDNEFKKVAASGKFDDLISVMGGYSTQLLSVIYKCYYGRRERLEEVSLSMMDEKYKNILLEIIPYEYVENGDKTKLLYLLDYLGEYTNKISGAMVGILTKHKDDTQFRHILVRLYATTRRLLNTLGEEGRLKLRMDWDIIPLFTLYTGATTSEEANMMFILLYLSVWFYNEHFKGFEEESNLSHLYIDNMDSLFYTPTLIRDVYGKRIMADISSAASTSQIT